MPRIYGFILAGCFSCLLWLFWEMTGSVLNERDSRYAPTRSMVICMWGVRAIFVPVLSLLALFSFLLAFHP